jgi:hypothetical protein
MVIAMREQSARLRQGVAFRRPAAAWLAIAALLSLCSSQPFHGATPIRVATAGPEASFIVAGSDLPSQHAAHDADLCSLCRATAQARLGLRISACMGELAASGACLPLHLPAAEQAGAAPALRNAQPRAPPTTLLSLSV